MMLYFLINKHEDCIRFLETNDAVGCNLTNVNGRYPLRFSGNFWWANASYIKNLDKIRYGSPMHDAEFWVINRPNVKAHSMHNSNVDHYYQNYPPEKIYLIFNCTYTPIKNLIKIAS